MSFEFWEDDLSFSSVMLNKPGKGRQGISGSLIIRSCTAWISVLLDEVFYEFQTITDISVAIMLPDIDLKLDFICLHKSTWFCGNKY